MSARSKMAQGFTLVEILIVVVILGILAAIVIPQFTRASEAAQASSLASQLQTFRSQLELYQVQHGGEYPDLTGAEGWDTMTTEINGYGPYFQHPPRNPLAPGADKTLVVAAPGTAGAWQWDETNHRIKAIVRSDVDTELTNAGLIEDSEDEHGDFVVDAGL